MQKSLTLVLALLIVSSLVLTACGAQAPTQAPAPPAQPPAQPPVKETVIVKETVQVKETVPVKETVIVQPTAAPIATPTAAPAATPTTAPGQVVAPKPASKGKLEFDIELPLVQPRKGDNKLQVIVVLHIRGGAKPFQVQESTKPQTLKVRLDNAAEYVVEYTRAWHNCGEPDPQAITVISGDGQKVTTNFMFPYTCQ